jgi:tRNA dimethylallyltransferase
LNELKVPASAEAGRQSQLVLLIGGATASGKSALAAHVAQAIGGMVINADSMQVYRDLRIITARPPPDEQAQVPHRLYGHVDAAENYSVGRWCGEARASLQEAKAAGLLPILVGGTGLYFKALTHGLAPVPAIAPCVRARVRARLEAEGVSAIGAELKERDPEMAQRIKPSDRARITRALEVVLATGRSLAQWHAEAMQPVLAREHTVRIFLDVERAELHARIEARFDAMLEAGALEEVRALFARRLDPSLPAMKAHGVPWLIRHLAGEIDLSTAAAAAKRDTKRYTKRQVTWFRHQLPDWTWISPELAFSHIRRALGR